MKEYCVNIREILEKEIVIQAETIQEAQAKAEEMYTNGIINLTSDDYKSTELDAKEVFKEKVKHIKGVDMGMLEIGKPATIINDAGQILKTSPIRDYFVAGGNVYIKTVNNSFYTTDKNMPGTDLMKNNNIGNKKKENMTKMF